MKFESVKCDECGRIQDGSNHWMKLVLWVADGAGNTVAIGQLCEGLAYRGLEAQTLDLCGQACAIKHLGKLLGWSAPKEGA